MRLPLLALAALALGSAAEAQPAADGPGRVVVNRYAVVSSADGYLNLREGPSTSSAVRRRMENGTLVWVRDCGSGAPGQRWCHVLLRSADGSGAYGFAFDAELALAAPTSLRDHDVNGAGVAAGFVPTEGPDAAPKEVWSRDGYVNGRAGPGTEHRVLTELQNEETVFLYACAPPGAGARDRWCLAERSESPGFVYIYTAELVLSRQP